MAIDVWIPLLINKELQCIIDWYCVYYKNKKTVIAAPYSPRCRRLHPYRQTMSVKVTNKTQPLAVVLFRVLEDVVVPVELPVLDLSREYALWGKQQHGCTTLTPAMQGKQRLIVAAKVITGNCNRGSHLGFCCSRSKCKRVAILGPRGFYLNQFFLKPVSFMFINEVALQFPQRRRRLAANHQIARLPAKK